MVRRIRNLLTMAGMETRNVERLDPSSRDSGSRRALPPTMERVTVVLAILLCAGTVACNWEAPQSARDVKNPVPPSAETLKQAKNLFNGNCAICHGVTGRGDGTIAASCTPNPANFTDSKLMDAETDGSLFWKISNGHESMPGFAWQIPETQRWQLVNFVRTFAKH
jgi:mono/diheme cytochrome c family protein